MIDVVGVVGAAVTSLSIALGVTTTVVFHLTSGHLTNLRINKIA